MPDLVSIRLLEPSDRSYVATRWIRQRIDGPSYLRRFERAVGFKLEKEHRTRYTLLVDHFIDEGKTLVLCDRKDRDNLLGFVNVARDLLGFVYVDRMLRGKGHGREFLRLAANQLANKFSLHPVVGWQWQKEKLCGWLQPQKEKAA